MLMLSRIWKNLLKNANYAYAKHDGWPMIKAGKIVHFLMPCDFLPLSKRNKSESNIPQVSTWICHMVFLFMLLTLSASEPITSTNKTNRSSPGSLSNWQEALSYHVIPWREGEETWLSPSIAANEATVTNSHQTKTQIKYKERKRVRGISTFIALFVAL